jgi:ABC-type multidrug transport system permease subunit
MKKLFDIRKKYLTLRKSIKTSLVTAKERKDQQRIKTLKQQLEIAKANYHKEISAHLKTMFRNKNKPKTLNKKQQLKQKYLQACKPVQDSLIVARKASDQTKIKSLKIQLKKLKFEYKKNKNPEYVVGKTNRIHNFTIISLLTSITCLLTLIVFALIGATNLVPSFEMIITDGSITIFGIVFISLLMLMIVMLTSSLAFYISQRNKEIKEKKIM